MRSKLGLVGVVALAACKGQAPQSAGAIPAAAPAGSTAAAAATQSPHSFVTPTEVKTYQAQGAIQSYSYNYNEFYTYTKDIVRNADGSAVVDSRGFPVREVNRNSRTFSGSSQNPQLYFGNAATVRDPKINVTYDPRNAVFTLVIAQNGVTQNATFQDPAHRTDFSNAVRPQAGVPNLEIAQAWRDKGVQYLESDNGSTTEVRDRITFFYELPGTSTRYVTYAGYVRNRVESPVETVTLDTAGNLFTVASSRRVYDRATFVFGEATGTAAVPKTGTGTYTGGMIASMVNNPNFENERTTYFQWLSGTATTRVDFGTGTVSTALAGTVFAPLLDSSPLLSPAANVPAPAAVPIPAGSTFAATAAARLDLVGAGGFVGTFSDARFTSNGVVRQVDIVGSSLDGAFYGPRAEEVGASFRIVGGVPDQRVDIIGSFTGKQ